MAPDRGSRSDGASGISVSAAGLARLWQRGSRLGHVAFKTDTMHD